jgi:hypothetical protein
LEIASGWHLVVVVSQLYNLFGSEAADEFCEKAADASSIDRPDQTSHPPVLRNQTMTEISASMPVSVMRRPLARVSRARAGIHAQTACGLAQGVARKRGLATRSAQSLTLK